MSNSESEDELDKLTRSFEAQASEDLKKISTLPRHVKAKPKGPKNMKEAREEGLNNPLSENSKGYQMLAKMGYKKGSGLGKDNIGAAEPIKLVLKEQRTGLGIDEDRKRRQEAVLEEQLERGAKRKQLGDKIQQGFAGLQSARNVERKYEGQVKAARKTIETLDRRKAFDRNFMWPPEPVPEEGAEDVDALGLVEEAAAAEPQEPTWEDQPVKNRLITVLSYLRSQHLYCLHCGCQYGDAEALEANCPGLMDDDH